MKPVDATHRKLRGVVAMLMDSGATEHERENAAMLKARLEKRLEQQGAPNGDWTDIVFRLGRKVHEIKKSASPLSAAGDSTKIAVRFGRAVGQGLRKWRAS
ncbi:MAG: hypothetical protein ACREFL_03885 [Stellaceae bacterium]